MRWIKRDREVSDEREEEEAEEEGLVK